MANPVGKEFEEKIRRALMTVDGATVDRISDQTSGYLGGTNIADFMIYRYPYLFYLECKSTHVGTLNFNQITNNQWDGLAKKSVVPGIHAGVVIWFVAYDLTVYVTIQQLVQLKLDGHKSVSVRHIREGKYKVVELEGKKKRKYFEYNGKQFLDDVSEETTHEN